MNRSDNVKGIVREVIVPGGENIKIELGMSAEGAVCVRRAYDLVVVHGNGDQTVWL